MAASVRDRAIASNRARSSAAIENSTTRRGAAMMPTHHIDTKTAYKPHRDRGNPSSRMTFMESMY